MYDCFVYSKFRRLKTRLSHRALAVKKRSGAESGWDFSSRWLGDGEHLSSIQAERVVPVDLNCALSRSCLGWWLKLNVGRRRKKEHKKTRGGRRFKGFNYPKLVVIPNVVQVWTKQHRLSYFIHVPIFCVRCFGLIFMETLATTIQIYLSFLKGNHDITPPSESRITPKDLKDLNLNPLFYIQNHQMRCLLGHLPPTSTNLTSRYQL